METPPARGNGTSRLQQQLDAASGQRMHRRGVSRQIEETFYTPKATMARRANATDNFGSAPKNDLNSTPNTLPNGSTQPALGGPFGSHSGTPMGTPMGTPTHRAGAFGAPNGAPNTAYSLPLSTSQPPAPSSSGSSSRPGGSGGSGGATARALSSRRRCSKCQGDITGHFVRALDSTYHIDCFVCDDCQTPCASKFFPLDGRPLCERCYFKRQNLLCFRCGNSLRGSYITALDRKYHVDHFTCSLCTTVFGPEDSYFEYDGDVYCRAHYAALFAFRCEGCTSPILKQFVETYRGGRQQQWHPECYMIFKFWSVKITDPHAQEMSQLRREIARGAAADRPLDARAARVVQHEEQIDKCTIRTWTTLCGFEESAAGCVGVLVRAACAGSFAQAHETCSRLVALCGVLFGALDMLPEDVEGENEAAAAPSTNVSPTSSSLNLGKGTKGTREAKTLCRKIVSYMSLLSKTRQMPSTDRLSVLAADLLPLASAMSHYLKVLIRQGLSRALRLDLLETFLNAVAQFPSARIAKPISPFSSDRCVVCEKAVEDRCFRQRDRGERLWHAKCFKCTKSGAVLDPNNAALENGQLVALEFAPGNKVHFQAVTRLEQYVVLLHVALARLQLVLSSKKTQPPGKPVVNHVQGVTALERASAALERKNGLTLDDIRRVVAAEQQRNGEKTDAKPESQHQPEKAVATKSTKSSPTVAQTKPAKTTVAQKPSSRSSSTSTASLPAGALYGTLKPEQLQLIQQQALSLLQDVPSSSSSTSIWGRVGKVFTKEDNRVFGQPLDRVVSKYGVDSALASSQYTLRIPAFVDDCISAMRQKDMSIEGIFRKNGNIRRIREFAEKIDRRPDELGVMVEESPIQLAALLKKFLRDLPDPLLTGKLMPLWSSVANSPPEKRQRLCQLLVAVLPPANRALLEVLVVFFNWVASFAHVDDENGSKMDVQNLATVLAPTLAVPREEASAENADAKYKSLIVAVKLLIEDYYVVARAPEDFKLTK